MPGETCLSCGNPVSGEELCSDCRTVRIQFSPDLERTGSRKSPPAAAGAYPLVQGLVGAEPALASLLGAFDQVRTSRSAAFVALEGPAGTGKTRLLAELAVAAARAPEARVHTAAAARAGVPYGPFVRLVGACLGLAPAASPDEARARVTAAVEELLPGPHRLEAAHLLSHLLGAGQKDSPILVPLAESPAKLEARAFLAVRRFFQAQAARAPLVLCIDDAEQATPEAVKLLHYLAATLQRSPILLIAAGRPGAPALTLPAPMEGFERVVLDLMRPADAEALLRELLAPTGTAPPKLVAHVRRAPTTPRTVVELVRLLLEAEVLVRRGGAFTIDEGRLAALALPESDAALTTTRLRLLPEEDRDLLDKAAVCGERFWLDALVALYRAEMMHSGDPDGPTLAEIATAGDGTREAAAHALARLAERGWVVEQAARVPGGREHRFAYAPLSDLVEAAMVPAVRRQHHRWIAQWLDLRPDGREEDSQEEIGRHFEEAGDGNAAAACYRRAADAARARYFNEKAVRLYTRALQRTSRGNLSTRIHLWHDLGSVHELKGDFESALDAYERMLRLTWVASSRSKAAVAMNKLGRIWRRKGNLRPALDYLERGLGLFEHAGDARGIAGSLDDIGHVLHLLGRYDEAHAKISEALARRGKDGDKRSIAHSLSGLGNVQKDRGLLDEAQKCHAQALELRREIGDRAGVVQSMESLAALALERGNRDEARRALEQALLDAERIGALPLQARLQASLGEVALAEAKPEEARRRLGDALGLARELDDRRLTADASRLLALAELAAGDVTKGRDLATRALALAEESGWRDLIGRALLALGETHAATLVDVGGDGSATSDGLRAGELFERGTAVFRELGNTGELARGLARQARHKLETGEEDVGRKLLDEARELYRKLGLPASRLM